MTGILKLGLAVGIGYAAGGEAGLWAIHTVAPSAGVTASNGAKWAGRTIVFLGTLYALR